MTPPPAIHGLVTRFAEQIDVYKSGSYNETQLRRDFLDPFFKELGWDMDNTLGYAEAYRDVIHEDQIKVGGAIKAPDYGFRIGGQRKFFLEAKKPSVRIKDEVSPAYQLRRYAWSAKLPLSILSDFEEFAIYDTRIKPSPRDPASKARIFYCRFEDYPQHWAHIHSIFARDSILRGSFDKYAATTRGKRGTAEVDADFLATIEGWRADLARNLALRNPALTQRELNFSVQRILDRIIFLRICEDRGIEDYERLKRTTDSKGIYPALVKLFQQADDRYNSGLFHFRAEKSRHEEHDTLTPWLAIDDSLLKSVIRGLYYPDSPYEFSVLSADILGQVYEQFLGKVITLDRSHRAKVEDKPEVKKAGGVFYTPTYIVDYIVKQTVGALIEGKMPKQIEKIRVLDPACGSGSFLIGAYQYLLDWYLAFYSTNDPVKHAKGKNPAVVAAAGGGWTLTTAERKRILLAHIYGVDIDSQAVEVTKLSLLLKVLEGETAQTVQRELIQERVLPDLGDNIKCGNSLIGSDFYDQPDLPEMDADAHFRINVFDWNGTEGFPEIMKAGGFDAVIGNPPYVLLQTSNDKSIFKYISGKYASAKYKIDTYHVFMERGLTLLVDGGYFGFITPSSYLRNKHALQLRKLLVFNSSIQNLRVFYYPVFRAASVDTSILITKRSAKPSRKNEVAIDSLRTKASVTQIKALQSTWARHESFEFSIPSQNNTSEIQKKIESASFPLGEIATAYFGIQTYDRSKYVLCAKPKGNFKPVIDGTHINRYRLSESDEVVDFRPDAIKSGGKSYVYEQDRIGVRQIGASPVVCWLPSGTYTLNTIYNIFLIRQSDVSLKFILGCIASTLMAWYWKQRFYDHKPTFPKIKKDALLQIPIPKKGSKNTVEGGRLVFLVNRMLALHPKRAAAKTPYEQAALDRQIAATDKQIDAEVYALYGLTPEEIAIVEGRDGTEVSSFQG